MRYSKCSLPTERYGSTFFEGGLAVDEVFSMPSYFVVLVQLSEIRACHE
jgi:hypothetical protein